MAAALVGTVAAADTASANDTSVAPATPLTLALTTATVAPHLFQPPPPADDARAPSVDVLQPLDAPPEGCAESCGPQQKVPPTDMILRQLGELPLLDTVMIPVTRGVIIEASDGTPAVTLAVNPTKITRGSGLVAIKRF